METYRIQKVQKRQTYVVYPLSGAGKSLVVTGSLPCVYPNMFISLSLDGKKIIDCKLNVDSRVNTKILLANGQDIITYKETLSRYYALREKGYSWEIASCQDVDALYQKLPFADADSLHKELVNNPKDKRRFFAINSEIIKKTRQRRKIEYGIEEYLSLFDEIEQEGAYTKLMYCVKMLGIMGNEFSFQGNHLFDVGLRNIENSVKEQILFLKNNAFELLTKDEISASVANLKRFDDDQKACLWSLQSSEPCNITGGAGVGKTSVVSALIQTYAKYYGKENILLLAPTGKAARRLTEKTGQKASTIHAGLRLSPEDNFMYYTKHNPLPQRLIIIDESSMIATELMSDLLNAVSLGTKLIFVGDPNQLYPVEYGEPFLDFLSLLTTYSLTTNHRQDKDSDIVTIANEILKGKPIRSGKGVSVNHIAKEQILDYLSTESDCQILSPYNEVNQGINAKLRKGENALNVHDKVILLRNTKQYSNGDIGTITAVLMDEYVVKVDDKQISVAKKDSSDIALAYALTIHKMQGSETNKVILFLPENDNFVSTQMLYTATTRAIKELLVYYYR